MTTAASADARSSPHHNNDKNSFKYTTLPQQPTSDSCTHHLNDYDSCNRRNGYYSDNRLRALVLTTTTHNNFNI